jgi:Ice-binding-like
MATSPKCNVGPDRGTVPVRRSSRAAGGSRSVHFGAIRRSHRLVVLSGVMAVAAFLAWPIAASAEVAAPPLATAANYAVIASSAITNTGATAINGSMAISPDTASSVTGFPPGAYTGTLITGPSAVAAQAETDLGTAYTDASTTTPFDNLTGTNLGGLTLDPGAYYFSSSAQLTGTLTLNGEGNTNPTFIFEIGSTLTTASAASVVLENGAGACAVFWQVGSAATLGTTTVFAGNIMAEASVTLNTGATIIDGRAMARTGAVTLDDNVITPPPASCVFAAATTTPTPTTTTPVTGTFGTTPNGVPLVLIALACLAVGILTTSTGFWVRRHRA